MSVWKSDEKLLISASLISPSKIILFEKKYQGFDTVFHQQMKQHLMLDINNVCILHQHIRLVQMPFSVASLA